MNELLNDFKQKILSTNVPNLKIEEFNGNIKITSRKATGTINFYALEVLIVEMSVTNLADGENKFYLHFEFRDLAQAEDNFKAMLRSFTDSDSERPLKILFTCTGGLTTGFFAETLNEASKILSRKFKFDALPESKLKEVGANYDVIMLAPQISYLLHEISVLFPDTLVLKLPPKLFASYNANELIKFFNWYAKYGHV